MFRDLVGEKKFYRFTGPPENWLTCIKHMTWGLKEQYQKRWNEIMPGDIFLMHSTSTNTRLKNMPSGIIGFGVVGGNKRKKTDFLWLEEKEKKENIWPLLVPFSEIYLFSPWYLKEKMPEVKSDNLNEIQRYAEDLVAKIVPLNKLSGFPAMGSFSSVNDNVVDSIFNLSNDLFWKEADIEKGKDYIETPLQKFKKKEDIYRYGTSLNILDEVRKKTINTEKSQYTKDNTLLERAESEHQSTLEKLRLFFKSKGYDVYYNKHIDLFTFNEKQSFLFEVKSLHEKNFLSQSRKGIVQLFEYEYFEIKNFFKEKDTPEIKPFKNITYSKEPKDDNYIKFINSLNLGATYFRDNSLSAFGKKIGIDNI